MEGCWEAGRLLRASGYFPVSHALSDSVAMGCRACVQACGCQYPGRVRPGTPAHPSFALLFKKKCFRSESLSLPHMSRPFPVHAIPRPPPPPPVQKLEESQEAGLRLEEHLQRAGAELAAVQRRADLEASFREKVETDAHGLRLALAKAERELGATRQAVEFADAQQASSRSAQAELLARLGPQVAGLEAKFTARVAELEAEVLKAQQRADLAETARSEADDARVQTLRELDAEKMRLTQQVTSARVMLQQERQRRDEAVEKARARETAYGKEIHEKLACLERDLRQAAADRKSVEVERDRIRGELEVARREAAAARAQAAAATQSCDDAIARERRHFDAEREELKMTLAAQREENEHNQQELDRLNDVLSCTERERAALQARIAELEAAQRAERKRREELSRTRKQLMEDRVRLEQALRVELLHGHATAPARRPAAAALSALAATTSAGGVAANHVAADHASRSPTSPAPPHASGPSAIQVRAARVQLAGAGSSGRGG